MPDRSDDCRPNGAALAVVVPAHDEAAVIERCLAAMLAEAEPDEFEIVVVCNGCTDDTAARARRSAPKARVIELSEASKAMALRAGDAAASVFPRCYVDADVVVSTATLRAVAATLREPTDVVVAAPRARAALADRPWTVRAFYRVWTSLPFFADGFVGAGFYAFSRAGRRRFGDFPDLIADDGFARLVARPTERRTLDAVEFTFFPPRRLGAVLGVMTRIRAGRRQLRAAHPELLANETTDLGRSLRFLRKRPSLWLPATVYLAVMALAELRARRQLRVGRRVPWQQDVTSRGPAAATEEAAR